MTKTIKRSLVSLLAVFALVLALPGVAHAYTQKETIVNDGHGWASPSYLVIHETANPGASAYNHMLLYSRGYDYAVQYVMELDGSVVYHTMNDDRYAWAVGNGNPYCVNIELAHATTMDDFYAQWDEAVKWAGDYLNARGWGIDRLLCHNDARLRWGGTDHTDPIGYFNDYGKSWNQFKADVAAYMATGQTGGAIEYDSNDTNSNASSGFGGTYTVMADVLNIRSAPWGAVVGSYNRGATVVLDDWVTSSGGYIWGRYTAYSGNVRYVAVGRDTGSVEADDYLVKGGTAGGSSYATNSGSGTYRFNSTMNVRSGAGTGYAVVAQYGVGQTVNIESTVNAGGYTWGRYTSWSGYTRYVALDWATKIA